MQEIIKLSLFVNEAGEHTGRNAEEDQKKKKKTLRSWGVTAWNQVLLTGFINVFSQQANGIHEINLLKLIPNTLCTMVIAHHQGHSFWSWKPVMKF